MCSNTINYYFSTNSTKGCKSLVLLCIIFSLAVQLQPVSGSEVSDEGFNLSDSNIRPDLYSNQQHQPENCYPASDTPNRSFLDRNHPLLITVIIGLILILGVVVNSHVETKKALRPLKKKAVDLNRNLWKMSFAYENVQEELDEYKKTILASDDSTPTIESLETELRLVKQMNDENQDLMKKMKKALFHSKNVINEMEDREAKTTKEKDGVKMKNITKEQLVPA